MLGVVYYFQSNCQNMGLPPAHCRMVYPFLSISYLYHTVYHDEDVNPLYRYIYIDDGLSMVSIHFWPCKHLEMAIEERVDQDP